MIPVLILFFGFFLFVKKAYDSRLEMQATSRSAVAYHAAHSCRGSGPTVAPSGTVPGATSCMGSGGGTSASTSTGVLTTSQEQSSTVAAGGLSREVKAGSWMICDEAPQDGGIAGWIRYAGGMISSPFGAARPWDSNGCAP
ncbi:MAG: hypothetical protein HOO96_26070 [Polyangiaceae bacterium]|nr:hypothetical protein [Polyangiaceae bacterium]